MMLRPMLAKEYLNEKHKIRDDEHIWIQEKYDGERMLCSTRYHEPPIFYSRNQKALDMKDTPIYNEILRLMAELPYDCVGVTFDGEIIAMDQYHNHIKGFQAGAGKARGIYTDKSRLVYVIFDVIDSIACVSQKDRMDTLHTLSQVLPKDGAVRIAPLFAEGRYCDLEPKLSGWLKEVTEEGAEGLMIRRESTYQHKRTDALLKYKPVDTLDMHIAYTQPGSGKYIGMIGALVCTVWHDGYTYIATVGSGLTDDMRSENPEYYYNKIATVRYNGYFEHDGKRVLRFPRLNTISKAPHLVILTSSERPDIEELKENSKLDVKTGASVKIKGKDLWLSTFNQAYSGTVHHAERILMTENQEFEGTLYTYLEPCAECLKLARARGITSVEYSVPHKDKWNTPEYYEEVALWKDKGYDIVWKETT